MKVAITGATGFIGRHLVQSLLTRGHSVVALSRNYRKAISQLPRSVAVVEWRPPETDQWIDEVAQCDAIVNLSGENLSSGRWTPTKKKALLDSRLAAIHALKEAVSRHADGLLTFVEASAVGFYGARGDEELVETNTAGTGYLAEIATGCEEEATSLSGPSNRVVLIRTGIVLGKEAGLLPRLFTPLRLGFGGHPGSGAQWLSWIHIDDEVAAIIFLLEHPELKGAFNLTAPQPLRMREFVRLGGRLLHRPVWFPLPAWLLRTAFGEMADEALLSGQRVMPKRLEDAGFTFSYRDASTALLSLLGRRENGPSAPG